MWPFSKRNLSERATALKRGELVDMQQPPFRQFNQIFENDCRMVMTKSAFEACVELPGEVRGKADVPAIGRWGIVFLSFFTTFQDRDDDPHEGTFDVNVLMPSGFLVPKVLKVVLDHDLDGEDYFIFMLPDELWALEERQ